METESDMVNLPPAPGKNSDQENCNRGGGGRGRQWGRRRGRGYGRGGLTKESEYMEENSGEGHFRGRGRGRGNVRGSRAEDESGSGEVKTDRGHFRGGRRGRGRGSGGRGGGRGRGGYNNGPGVDEALSRFRGGRRRRRRRGPVERFNDEEVLETDVEVQEETCVCCTVISPKYKCPTCYLKYCSVACCKSHKVDGTCAKPADSAAATTTICPVTPTTLSGRTPYLFPTGHTVPLDKLTRLTTGGNLDRLKHFLSSSRVRNMILRLDKVEETNADSEFKAVMECPEFAEFASFATSVLNSDDEESESDD